MWTKQLLSLLIVAATIGGAVAPRSAGAQVQFVEVSGDAGIGDYTMHRGEGGGIAAADFDDDGDIDLFIPNGLQAPDQFYRNLGNGRFEEIAAQVGVASSGPGRSALWFDYDGDQLLDLLVADDCQHVQGSCSITLRLFKQVSEGQFVDKAEESDLSAFIRTHDHPSNSLFGGMAAGDLNNDGYLDFAIAVWRGESLLFLNNGDGTFSDISRNRGLERRGDRTFQNMMYDFNFDGWMDIYTSCDGCPNLLLINQMDNTFVDVAPEVGVDNPWAGMGTALGDYDNDGDIDIYVTNISRESGHNVLFRNDSSGQTLHFAEVAEESGVEDTGWGWGCSFLDANNDGLLDLAATNGSRFLDWRTDPSRFFLNQGGDPVTFSDVSDAVGFNDTFVAYALIALDYDRDGYLDLVQTTKRTGEDPSQLRLLKNHPGPEAGNNNFLVVKPRMNGLNHWAIGAVVRVRVGEVTLTRLITAGTSFLGQEPAEAHFGLGTATEVDQVVIEWPDGTESVFADIAANQVVILDNSSVNAGEGEGEGETSGEGEREGESAEGGEGDGEGEREGESAEGGEGDGESEREGESAEGEEGDSESELEGGEGDSEGEVGEEERQNGNNRPLTCSASSLAAGTEHTPFLEETRALRDFLIPRTSIGSGLASIYYEHRP